MKSLTTIKNKLNLYDICFILSAFAGFGILIAMPYQINSIISLGTYTIAGCAAIAFVKYFIEHIHHMPSYGVVLLVLILVCGVAVLFSHSNIRANLVKMVCFLEIPIFMLCGKEIQFKRTAKIYLWLQYGLSFYYFYLSRTDKAYAFQGPYGVVDLEELTLSYHNPNEAAMYLTACFISLWIAFVAYKKIILKVLFVVNSVFLFYLIWNTGSRAGIVVCALATIGLLLLKFFPVKGIITRIALFVPLIMVVLLYFFNEQLTEMQFLGSTVETGRTNVFDQVFSALEFHEIFVGDFATHNFDNLHNIYISIFGTIGIFGVIAYAIFMECVLGIEKNNQAYSLPQKMAYIGVLLLVVYSSVEASFFVGGSAFAWCFIGIYLLFIDENDDLGKQTENVSNLRKCIKWK